MNSLFGLGLTVHPFKTVDAYENDINKAIARAIGLPETSVFTDGNILSDATKKARAIRKTYKGTKEEILLRYLHEGVPSILTNVGRPDVIPYIIYEAPYFREEVIEVSTSGQINSAQNDESANKATTATYLIIGGVLLTTGLIIYFTTRE